MKLEQLIDSFSDLDNAEQLERIRKIRHARTIERPVAAKKRAVREERKSISTKGKVKKGLNKLSAEDRAAIIKALQGMKGSA